MKESKEMQNETGFNLLRLAIVGKEKGGKSRLAATAPKPVLVRDYDQRKESLAGIPGVFAVTYSDPPLPMMPNGFAEILDDTAKLEKEAIVKDFVPDASPEWRDKHIATVVEDSNASLARLIRSSILYANPKIRRDVNIGGKMTVHTIGSRDFYNSEMPTMEDYVLRVLALPMHVIMTFHEARGSAGFYGRESQVHRQDCAVSRQARSPVSVLQRGLAPRTRTRQRAKGSNCSGLLVHNLYQPSS